MNNEEVTLIEALVRLWHRRRTMLCFLLAGLLAGVILAFLLPRKYEVRCTLGLEVEDRTMRVSLEGIPTLQTLNMGNVNNTKVITPEMYPDILYSVPFLKELMYKSLFNPQEGDTTSFYDYYLMRKGMGEDPEMEASASVERLTKNEERCLHYLKNNIKAELRSKEGYLKLTVEMPDPEIAAYLAQEMQQMLQKYITQFRITKAQTALDFIDERYRELKEELEQKQQALVQFQEKNKGQNGILIQTEEKILTNDYELFFQLYSDIVKQREKAKIQVKENMPVLTVIEPVVMPRYPAKPRRGLIIGISLLVALIGGSVWVLSSSIFSDFSKQK